MFTSTQAKPAIANALELEAVVGYVFVVDGRALRGTPPGTRIEPPPKKPQRGRESDTIFMLVTPGSEPHEAAAFYEQLAKLACDLYFRSSGSVTSGLREAFTGVNSFLLSQAATAGAKKQANVIGMVLRGREAFVARAGAMISALRQGDTLVSAPDDLNDEFALNGLPLGYSEAPDIKYGRHEIAPGQALLLSDLGLVAMGRDRLYKALTGPDNNAIQAALKAHAEPQTQAMIIEFRVPEPVPVPAPPVEKTAENLFQKPAPKPPAQPNSAAPTGPMPGITEPAGAGEAAAAPDGAIDAASNPSANGAESLAAAPATNAVVVAAASASAALPAPAIKKSAWYRFTHGVAWLLRGVARLINAVLDKVLPEPKQGAPSISTVTAISIAILIPVVVVCVMVGFRLSQVDATNFEQVVVQIEDQANQAANTPVTDEERARTLWLAVMQRIETAEVQRPGDPTLARVRARAQGALDAFAKVTRKVPVPLRTFPANADMGSILVQGGTDLYTLDRTTNGIFRDTLRQPDQIAGTRGQTPIVQAGSPVGGYTISRLIALIWVDEGGIRNSHALVGLDAQGFLVTYSPAFPPAQAQALPGSERWKKPVAMHIWQEKLYLLDPTANQIWRYVPSGTTYPNPPTEYFDQELNRNLAEAVDFAIDERGSVYVLFRNGTMKKFNSGSEQNFILNGIPEGGMRAPNAMVIDNTDSLSTIYVTDPVDQSIFEFTLAGTFQNRFRPTDPAAFKRLSSIYVSGKKAYVTDGNVLYYVDLTPVNK
jgi:hypothetical protein